MQMLVGVGLGLGFRVWFRVLGLGFQGFGVSGLRLSGFRVQG